MSELPVITYVRIDEHTLVEIRSDSFVSAKEAKLNIETKVIDGEKGFLTIESSLPTKSSIKYRFINLQKVSNHINFLEEENTRIRNEKIDELNRLIEEREEFLSSNSETYDTSRMQESLNYAYSLPIVKEMPEDNFDSCIVGKCGLVANLIADE